MQCIFGGFIWGILNNGRGELAHYLLNALRAYTLLVIVVKLGATVYIYECITYVHIY